VPPGSFCVGERREASGGQGEAPPLPAPSPLKGFALENPFSSAALQPREAVYGTTLSMIHVVIELPFSSAVKPSPSMAMSASCAQCSPSAMLPEVRIA